MSVLRVSCAVAVVVLALPLLSACAGGPQTRPVAQSNFSNDQAYIARVEQIATRRGIRVEWVNPPAQKTATLASVD
ncbi:hypothetical protein [Coralloluteibacterium stylophorae]|uniref:Uncharacterized protein n=1 Tax=Coralloluteibacterium stylophorae TaxID=1776034 RepID=A0A8J7VVI2_9GAMM|nr:hypothetical protein [Coralloluteibacterium stylophorae]MBS7456439.1 hypothetical protein [Coralloluteibacterium stylophorae]